MSASAKPAEKVLKSFLVAALAISFCPQIHDKAQAQETSGAELTASSQNADEGAVESIDSDSESFAPTAEGEFGGDDGVAPLSNDSEIPIVDWTEYGTCQWMIDAGGCLTIEPLPGRDIGEFPLDRYSIPWNISHRWDFTAVNVKPGVRLIDEQSGDVSMSDMFSSNPNLVSANLSGLDTSNVTDMSRVFDGCSSLVSLDLSCLNTSNVTDMGMMFRGCSKLTELDLSSFNTSKVANMDGVFEGCSSLTFLNVSSWNTSSVANMAYMFSGCSSLASLDLSSFDTPNVKGAQGRDYEGMRGMFRGCASLTSLNLTGFSSINPTDSSGMFSDCSALEKIEFPNSRKFRTYNSALMFSGCSSLTSLDLSSFDTSNVTNMACMFSGCTSLAKLDLLSFDTSNVEGDSGYSPSGMSFMFSGCSSLANLDLSSFNTSNVANMASMFAGCESLQSLDLSNFNTSRVMDMSNMFGRCALLKSLDLSPFDTSNVTNMVGLFSGCSSLVSLDFSSLSTSNVTDISRMFYSCRSLESLDLSGFDFSHVTSMDGMLYQCSGLRLISVSDSFALISNRGDKYPASFPTPSGDGFTGRWVSSVDGIAYTPDGVPSNVAATYTAQREGDCAWNQIGTCLWCVDDAGALTIKPLSGFRGELPELGYRTWPWKEASDDVKAIVVKSSVIAPAKNSGMFSSFPYLKTADLSGLDVSSMMDMRSMFAGCKSLREINAPGFSTSEVTDMSSMFSGCSSLESLDLSGFNTSKVTNMSSMFADCSSLATLDVSTFDTSKVTDMRWMFSNCSFLKNLDLSNFDTGKVTDMSCLFYGCSALRTIAFGNPDTSKTTSMNAMFYNCSSLESVDSLRFGTSKVLDMGFMFSGCSKLSELDLSTFDTSSVTNMGSMFQSCGMEHLDLSGFDTSSVTDMSYMFNSSSIQNLDLSSFNTSRVTKMSGMFGGGSSLRSVVLGGKFTFNGRDTSRMCSLPTPYFTNATGLWASSADGKAYAPDSIPNNVAATYTAQVKGETPKTVITKSMFAVDTGAKTYTGLKIMPEVSSNTLRKGTDYTVSYGENVNAGTGSVTVTGAGSYTGTLSYSFTINKAVPSYTVPLGLSAVYGQTLGDVTLPAGFSWQGGASTKVGDVGHKTFLATYTPVDAVNYETVSGIEVDLNVTPGTLDEDDFFFDLSDAVYTGEPVVGRVSSKTLVERTDYDVAYADNVKAGTASVTVTGIGNYEGSAITKHFTIEKADPTYETPGAINATEGQTLGDLKLPDGFSWQDDPSTDIGDAGEHSFMARFTPGDAANYNSVENIPVTVKVAAHGEAEGWNIVGDCAWKVDDRGCLVIKPANGVSGTLENFTNESGNLMPKTPWEDRSDEILSARFEGKVTAGPNLSFIFWQLKKLESVDLSNLDISNTRRMCLSFGNCYRLKEVKGFDSRKNVSLKDTRQMFYGCLCLNDLDLSGLDTRDAIAMSEMFEGCQSLGTVTFGENFSFRGAGTERLCSLPTPWENGSTGLWGNAKGQTFAPSEVPDGAGEYAAIFPALPDGWKAIGDCAWKIDGRGCLVIKPANGVSGTLENFTTLVENENGYLCNKTPWEDYSDEIVSARFDEGVTADPDLADIFWQLHKLESADFSNLDTSRVKSMVDAFRCCESLKRVDGLGSKGGMALEDATEMFSLCRSLKAVDLSDVDLSGLDSAGWMFADCSSLEELDLPSIGFKDSQFGSLSGMLYGCSSLKRVDLSGMDTRGARSMRDMFSGSDSLESVTLGENFSFSGMSTERLCSLPTPEKDGFEGKWRNAAGEAFAPSEVPDGAGTYAAAFPEHPDGWAGCGTCMWGIDGDGKLTIKPIDGESGELAEWGDDGVAPWEDGHFYQQRAGVSEIVVEGHVLAPVNAHGMFFGFPSVETIDLSGLDTSRTTNMMQMFACSNAKAIDVSSFDTSNVTNMKWMFLQCDNLESLDLSSFDTLKVSDAWGWIGSPDERWSLKEITLGGKFDFKGNGDMKGSSTGREPLESHTFGGIMTPKLIVDKVDTSPYTGNWVSVGTGESYSSRDELPSSTAATYRAQRKLLESDFSVDVSDAVYSGEAVVGRVESDSLKEGADYDVAYSDNVNAGTATVGVTGKGFYTGTLSYTFKIDPAAITADMISGIPAKVEATGEQLRPEPTVKFNGKTLEKGKDYTVAYGENKEPGKGTVTVAAVEGGNFTESATVEFEIEKKAEPVNPDPGTGGGGTDPAPTPDSGTGGGSGGGGGAPAPAPQQFAVTYHLDGGVNAASNPTTFTAGTAVALDAPTREGYEFLGWYADSKFEVRVTEIPADASGDVDLWAKWALKAAPAPTFPDVDYSESSWYGKAVTYVAERGLITGYTAGEKAGQFGVGDSLTRAQLAIILWRNACPEEAASYDPATARDDTGIAGSADGMYYTAAANWAVKNGVITGFVRDDGTQDFAADETVSFEQLVTILARLCAAPGELASAGSDLSAFADGADASSWSRSAFAWAASKGLVEGYDTPSGKVLAPGEDVARERVAVVLMRAFEMGILK